MILFVTSFSKLLFEATGKWLVDSFLRKYKSSDDHLWISFDGWNYVHHSPRLHLHGLDLDHEFTDWVTRMLPYIPRELNGAAPPCDCKVDESLDVYAKAVKHKKGCAHSLWNRRAAQWACKTFAMKRAIELDPDYIVWIDCDCRFATRLTTHILESIMGRAEAFYHFGPYRRISSMSIETGLFGFRRSAFDMIQKAYDAYVSMSFLDEYRWDDSWLYTKIMDQQNRDRCVDVVEHTTRKSSHVVASGPFRQYVIHDKGVHHRKAVV